MVARDRGEIEWVGLDGDVAEVILRGACVGCPGQAYTINEVVLPALRAVDPTIVRIRVRSQL